jgi:hypothetical protein
VWKLPYWSKEIFVADRETWPHRRRVKLDVCGTEVSVDGRFAAAVLGYSALTAILFALGATMRWRAVLVGAGSGFVGLVVHELGHACATRWRGHSLRWVAFSAPSSATGNFAAGERYSPQTLAVVALAGPAVNVGSAVLLLAGWWLAHGHMKVAFMTAALVNGAGIVNLWPAKATSPTGAQRVPTDGGLVLRAISSARTGVVPE